MLFLLTRLGPTLQLPLPGKRELSLQLHSLGASVSFPRLIALMPLKLLENEILLTRFIEHLLGSHDPSFTLYDIVDAKLYFTHFQMKLKKRKHLVQVPRGFPGEAVKNPPAKQETRVRSLSGEDPPKKEMATHSSILAWRIPWTEEPGGL